MLYQVEEHNTYKVEEDAKMAESWNIFVQDYLVFNSFVLLS